MRCGSIKKLLQLLASASNASKHKECNYDPTGKPSNCNVARCAVLSFPICLVLCSCSWNLDTKFCLHAAGAIYVDGNFEHLEGKIKISGSSAKKHGGGVLRSSS